VTEFKCPECRMSFKTVKGRSVHHTNIHVLGTGNKPYACKHCDRMYKSVEGLRRHMRAVHGLFPRVGEVVI